MCILIWIICFVATLSLMVSLYSEHFIYLLIGIVGITCSFILAIEIENRPAAMDVYRGRTTLEITYKDNVAIDSTVVFKDK